MEHGVEGSCGTWKWEKWPNIICRFTDIPLAVRLGLGFGQGLVLGLGLDLGFGWGYRFNSSSIWHQVSHKKQTNTTHFWMLGIDDFIWGYVKQIAVKHAYG